MSQSCTDTFVVRDGSTVPCILPRGHEGHHALQMQEPDQPVHSGLLNTTDPMEWATEWVSVARKRQAYEESLLEPDWMVGWFANAMEVGARDADPVRHRKPAKTSKAAYEQYLT